MNKVRFTLIYGIGWCQLAFSKTYELKFVPFEGMHFYHETDEYSVSFDLIKSRHQDVRIFYNLKEHEFSVDVQHKWEWAKMDRQNILDTIKSINALGWKTTSDQNAIDEFVRIYSHPESKDHE